MIVITCTFSAPNLNDVFFFIGIKNQQMSLLTLIENLSTALLDVNPSKRCKALSVLTRVVELLLPDHLGEKDLAVIADFFCSKLKDHHSILPVALDGLQSLVSYQIRPAYRFLSRAFAKIFLMGLRH